MTALRIIFSILSFVLGASLASFAGVIACRAPKGESIIKPASHCTSCGHVLAWYENIPRFSYIFLRGKCKNCKAPIGVFGFVCEVLGGLGYLAVYLVFGPGYHLAFGFAIGLLFLIISGIDWQTNDIYDVTSLLFALLAGGFTLCDGLYNKYIPYNRFIGAAIGFALFFLISVIAKHIYKHEALGMGDVFIVTAAGLLLGYINLLFSLTIAAVTALCVEGGLIVTKKKQKGDYIAFAPYLCLGFYVMYIFGDFLLDLIL